MPGRCSQGLPGFGGGGGFGRKSGLGGGKGRMNGSVQTGPNGFCICSNCGTKLPHKQAQPCSNVKCPHCGSAMVRA